MGCNSSKQTAQASQNPQHTQPSVAAGEPEKTLHAQMQQNQENGIDAKTAASGMDQPEVLGTSSEPANVPSAEAPNEVDVEKPEHAHAVTAAEEALPVKEQVVETRMAAEEVPVVEPTLGDVFKFDDENKFFKAQLEKLPLEDPELKTAVAAGGAAHGLVEKVTLSATNERSNAFVVKGPVGDPVRVEVFMNSNWPEELISAVEAVTGSVETDDDGAEASEINRLADVFTFGDDNPFFKQQVENLPLEDDKLKAAFLPGGTLYKRAKMVSLVATNERSNSFLVRGPVGEPVRVQLFLNPQWTGDLLAAVSKVTSGASPTEEREAVAVKTLEAPKEPSSSFWFCCTQPSIE